MRLRRGMLGWIGMVVLLTGGCASTYINFDGPPGTVLFVKDKPYHLPSRVEFTRPAGAGQSNRSDIGLVFPSPAGDVHAEGHIDVYGYNESDIDKVSTNTCKFEDSQLSNLASGTILVYKGQTVSRQPLFDLTLTKK